MRRRPAGRQASSGAKFKAARALAESPVRERRRREQSSFSPGCNKGSRPRRGARARARRERPVPASHSGGARLPARTAQEPQSSGTPRRRRRGWRAGPGGAGRAARLQAALWQPAQWRPRPYPLPSPSPLPRSLAPSLPPSLPTSLNRAFSIFQAPKAGRTLDFCVAFCKSFTLFPHLLSAKTSTCQAHSMNKTGKTSLLRDLTL